MEKHQQKTDPVHKKTGASNVQFDLISEMHSLLKGNAALEQYVEDARQAGEREVETIFQTIHDQNKEHVNKLRDILARELKAS